MSTLTDLQARLAKYEAAESAILDGAQQYSINGRSLTRANLDEIAKMIEYLQARIDRIDVNSGTRGNRIAPLFPWQRH